MCRIASGSACATASRGTVHLGSAWTSRRDIVDAKLWHMVCVIGPDYSRIPRKQARCISVRQKTVGVTRFPRLGQGVLMVMLCG